MSQTSAINQELLRQINDSVGYRIKTKVDTLLSQTGGDSSNISFIRSFFPSISNNVAATYALTQSISPKVTDTYSNVLYLSEVTAINDTSLASTDSKSLAFHKFLTTEHIPGSNIFSPVGNLKNTEDTYVTGHGAIGVRKDGVNVFEEYYNGQYPGSMFGTFSCGKEMMGLVFGRLMKKGLALHNLGTTDYTSNVLDLNTTVEQIIYGTDIKKYGETGITLPRGLEKARMRDLLSMRAGFHEYDGLLWFMYIETVFTGGALTNLSAFYALWAGTLVSVANRIAITTFDHIKNLGNEEVNMRNFGLYIKNDYLTQGPNYASTSGLYIYLTYAFLINLTSANVVGDMFVGDGYSNTSTRYHRSGYAELYGTDKFEHYNNECFTFATEMMQIALAKEAKYGDGRVLPYNTFYSNVTALSTIASNTFAGQVSSSYVNSVRDNFRTFFKNEILVPSGVPSATTKLTELQSNDYGTIMCDNTRVAFPHFMGINDTFAKDLFLVRDTPTAVTPVYSNLFLSNITLYDFTAVSSNIIPYMNPLEADPFNAFVGEFLNAQTSLSMTNGIWTRTNVLPNNRQESSNVYFMQGSQGQKCYMGRDASGSRYTVGMLSDDYVNNPLLCQGPEFLQDNKNTITAVQASAAAHGKYDTTSLSVQYWFPDSVSVPFYAGGASAVFGVRTRQEADKVISAIQDIKVSSNNWGYDSVGGLTLRLNAARAYYSNLTTSNAIKPAYTSNGVPYGTSNCLADVHYSQYDIFERATSTF